MYQFTSTSTLHSSLSCVPSSPAGGWCRLVLEKPFGRDLSTASSLNLSLRVLFPETMLCRIDHYLGKSAVKALLPLRFGTPALSKCWERDCVEYIHVSQKETALVKGRGAYFDSYGIIRDVIQNHLLQILTLLLMSAPSSSLPDDVRSQKVAVLASLRPLSGTSVVLGQYVGYGGADDLSFPPRLPGTGPSKTPTYAAILCHADVHAWRDVPIVLEAGKAMDERKCEVRIGLRRRPDAPANEEQQQQQQQQGRRRRRGGEREELVIRIQPEPAVYLTTVKRRGGQGGGGDDEGCEPPCGASSSSPPPPPPSAEVDDAYAQLLEDALSGRMMSFVREDELLRSWEIFTPLLEELEGGGEKPRGYDVGGRGPEEARETVDRWLGKEPRGKDEEEEECDVKIIAATDAEKLRPRTSKL